MIAHSNNMPAMSQQNTGKRARAAPSQKASGADKRQKTSHDDAREEESLRVPVPTIVSSSRSHVRFGSEEPRPEQLDLLETTKIPALTDESADHDEDDIDSDDDEAPEAVSMTVAAASNRAAAAGRTQSIQQ